MTLAEKYEIAVAALRDAARLNCAKPPFGKHYKDETYCGECTSCRMRNTLDILGVGDPHESK